MRKVVRPMAPASLAGTVQWFGCFILFAVSAYYCAISLKESYDTIGIGDDISKLVKPSSLVLWAKFIAHFFLTTYFLVILRQNFRLPGEPAVFFSWIPYLGSVRTILTQNNFYKITCKKCM